MYAIRVMFCRNGIWSKPYTYKCDFFVEKGNAVMVPTGNWYSVGKVQEVFDARVYEWREDIKYTNAIMKVVL